MRIVWQPVFCGGFAALNLLLAGCVADDGLASFVATAPGTPPISGDVNPPAPIPSTMPWQLTPASTASIAQGEKTIIVASDHFGRIKGTPVAIANLEKPLFAFARRGHIVAACRQTIEPKAKEIGAYSVQAAAAGPERRRADGERTQQVFFRIIYDRPAYLEIRQSALLCTINPSGQLIDAHPV